MPYLIDLDLSHNKIESLSPLAEAKKLGLLRKLNASNNCLKQLSKLSNLVKLTTLDVSKNQIAVIELDGLPSLVSLTLSHNKIKDLNGMEYFPELTKILADNNNIDCWLDSHLNIDVNQLNNQHAKLQTLILNHNPLNEKIPDDARKVRRCAKLKVLDLSFSQLTEKESLVGFVSINKLSKSLKNLMINDCTWWATEEEAGRPTKDAILKDHVYLDKLNGEDVEPETKEAIQQALNDETEAKAKEDKKNAVKQLAAKHLVKKQE